jgi:hypothetical protein
MATTPNTALPDSITSNIQTYVTMYNLVRRQVINMSYAFRMKAVSVLKCAKTVMFANEMESCFRHIGSSLISIST